MSSKYLLDCSMKVQKLHSNVRSKLQSGLIITDATQCVLELVENSLDAEATAIGVRIKLSKYEIEVLDNGVGISKNNLDLIGNRFMTSKCHEASDLNKTLFTYGFRGQALASLLDLCQILTIKTKSEKNKSILTKVFKNGKSTIFVMDCKEKSFTGTTVIVSDFMFSMPVRRKRIAEAFDLNEIKTQLQYLAVIHNKVCFTLRDEDRSVVLLQTQKTSDSRLSFADLFGLSVHRCLSVYYKEENYEMNGFICLNRYSENNLQFIYVNKRIVFNSLVHKFINSLIDKYFEENRDLVNEAVILQGFSSNIPKGQHSAYVIQIHCPYTYFEFFSNFRKRTVEFSNWNDISNFIRNGIYKVLNLSKKTINAVEYKSLKGVNLTNLENTLLGSQPKTIASDIFTKKKGNRKSSRVNLKNYINDSLEVEIQKNGCFYSGQKKLIMNYIKKLFLKMMTMKFHKINATKSVLLKKIRKMIKFPSKFTIFTQVLEMLKIKDLSYLHTLKKKYLKKFKLFLIMCSFINFAIFLKSEAKHLNAFKHYNEVIEKNFSKVFGSSHVEKLFVQKSITDFFKGKDKLKSVKGIVHSNKSDLGKKDEIYCNNMLITDTWKDKGKDINYIWPICSERKNKISRKEHAKLSVKNSFYESEKDGMKSNHAISNVEKSNKLNGKNNEVLYEADRPSKFSLQRDILSSKICSNMKFFQRVELSFEGTSDSGCKLFSNSDAITTKSLISHCRNRNSFISNIKNNWRTISETISLNNMIRKRKKKINYLSRKKMSKRLMMMFLNILKFHRSLKSSFKHYLFRRKMRCFHLLKDAHMQAKILKCKNNKQVQTTPMAFPVEKLDVAVRSNGKDIRLVTCKNSDTEYRFLGYENEIREKKEIESSHLNKRSELTQSMKGMKTIANDPRNIKDFSPSSYNSFNTMQSMTASKLSKSRNLLEANNIFPNTKMWDSNNLYESVPNDKETFNLNSDFLQAAQTSDHSMFTISTNEMDILSEVNTKVFTPHSLNVDENTQNIAEISDKNVIDSKENESEKFISNDLPITTIESKKFTNFKNRFTVSERYSFIPKGLSQMMCDKNPGFLNDKRSLILINWNCQLFRGNYCKLRSNYMNVFESKNKSFHNNTGSFSHPAFENNIVRDVCLKSEENLVHYENHVIKAELSKSALKVHNLSNSFAISKDILQNLKIIGQWDKKFIVATMGISNPYKMQILTIFDQHAVDERIQLEKLMEEFRTSDGKIISCDCNPPIKCVLSKSDVCLIPFLKNRLMESGIEVSVLDSQTIKFYKIPLCLIEKEEENANAGKVIDLLRSLIVDIIQEFIETRGTISSIPKVLHNIISMKACKKAIKFNQALSMEAMNKTIIELFECQFPFQCAHGRPTIIPILDILELANMEKKQKPKLNFKQLSSMKTQM